MVPSREGLQTSETSQVGVVRDRACYSRHELNTQAISLLVPTYNEAQNLPELLVRIQEILHAGFQYEVVIADDDSTDGTVEVARRLSAALSIPLRVVQRKGPRSLALSVIEAAKEAKNPCVVVLDADLSHDTSDIPKLANAVLGGRCEVAVASRYANGGDIGKWPCSRRFLSSVGTRLARLLTSVDDPLSGYFACPRDLLANAPDLCPRGYKILFEILGRRPGIPVMQFQTCFKDRLKGSSKLKLRQKMEFLLQLLSLFRFRLQSRVRSFRVLPWVPS